MDTNITLEQVREFNLQAMARSYEAVLELPVHQHPEAHILVAQLAESEHRSRTQYKTAFYLKLRNCATR